MSPSRFERAAVDSADLVVLLPEVGLDNLGRRQESQDRRVAGGERAGVGFGLHAGGFDTRGQESAGRDERTRHANPFQKCPPPDDVVPAHMKVIVALTSVWR